MDEMRASSPSEEHEEETDAAAILAMKERVAMMHSEAGLLREMTLKAAADEAAAARPDEVDPTAADKEAVDSRSVYVGNVTSTLSLLPPATHSLRPGRLRRHPGRTAASLCDRRRHQPHNHPFR